MSPPVSSLLVALTPSEQEDFLPPPVHSRLRSLPVRSEHLSLPLRDDTDWPELLRERGGILLSCWGTPRLPEDLPVGESGLRYVCHLAGSIRKLVPRSLIERGLRVSNWGSSISRTVAECALHLILSALRRGSFWAVAMHRDGLWKDSSTVTQSLFERPVGLHGFGLVAQNLVLLLRPFGVQISVYCPGVTDELLAAHGVERSLSLEELFSQNEIVVELAPFTPENYHIVTESLLRLIRPGGVFVNVGRGGVVDETALARVAAEGRIQVALDVYEVEPLPVASPLRGLPNVTLLPHIAGPTKDRRQDCGEFGIANVERYLMNRPLKAEVTLDIYDHSS